MTTYKVLLSSEFKDSSSASGSDALFKFNNPKKVKSVHIKRINILRSWPTVITGFNDTFVVNYNATGDTTVTLTSDNYTIDTLVTELQTQLQTVDAGFTVTETSYNHITITHSTNTFTMDFTGSELYRLLGFNKTTYGAVLTDESDNAYDLFGHSRAIYLTSARLMQESEMTYTNQIENMVTVILNDVAWGYPINQDDGESGKIYYNTPVVFNNIDIQFRFSTGYIVPLDNAHWYIEMEITTDE